MDKWTLRQYIPLTKEIKLLESERDEILRCAVGAVNNDGLPHAKGGVSDPAFNVAAKMLGIGCVLDSKIEEAVALRVLIEKAIGSLTDSNERHLMRLRYVEGASWEEIAEELGYSVRQTLRRHGICLKKISGTTLPEK